MVRERGGDAVKPLRNGLFCKCVLLVAFLSINLTVCACERIAPERCLIWGPGLNPDVVLPVRYFIIQAVNSKGGNLTLSPGKLYTGIVCATSVVMFNTASLERLCRAVAAS